MTGYSGYAIARWFSYNVELEEITEFNYIWVLGNI